MTKNERMTRRTALRRMFATLAGAALGAPVLAQMNHQHGQGSGHGHGQGHGQGHGHGQGMGGMNHQAGAGATPPPAGGMAHGHPAAHAINWESGSCAFCGMTLTTPAGAPMGAGFRERTYAQWAFEGEAREFESIGCALGWAYAHNVRDGSGAALYVAAYDQSAPPTTAELLPARDAVYLWAENLPASMQAKLGAFAHEGALDAFVAARGADLGRHRSVDLTLLTDMAPLPIAGLFNLLQRQMG